MDQDFKSPHFLPQPRKIECDDVQACRPAEITIQVEGTDPTLLLAGRELAEFFSERTDLPIASFLPGNSKETKSFIIHIAQGTARELPQHGYQRYCILPDSRGLQIIGQEPVGAYYAVKTLKQAVCFDNQKVHIPLLHVSDCADLAERGFWDYFYPAPVRPASEMFTFKDRPAWYKFLNDFADYKLNLLELLLTDEGLLYNSERFPQLIQPGTPADKNDIIRDVLTYARQRGIRIYLTLGHPEHTAKIISDCPEIKAINPCGCQPYLFPRLYCFSHPKTREYFSAIFEEIAELFHPDGIYVWSPENLGYCTCPECRAKGYLAQYYSLYQEAFNRIRLRQPEFKLRFLVSFLRYSSTTLTMVPADAELVYYECDRHGLYGYDADKFLPSHLTHQAQRGRKLLGCVNFRASGQKYVPLPILENVAGWVRLLVEGGWYGVDGSTYSSPGVCRLNLLRMADVAWNAAGHDLPGFLDAYCRLHKLNRPAARARILAVLSTGWETYHRVSRDFLETSALEWILKRNDVNYLDSLYLTDALEYRDLPLLRRVMDDVNQGKQMAVELNDPDLICQLQICELRLHVLLHVFSALHVFGRQQWPDPEKGPWGSRWLEEMQKHLGLAKESLLELPKITAQVHSIFPAVQADAAVREDGCLKMIDSILAPEFLEKMKKQGWADIDAFA